MFKTVVFLPLATPFDKLMSNEGGAGIFWTHDLPSLKSRCLSLQLATLFSDEEIRNVFEIRYPSMAMES